MPLAYTRDDRARQITVVSSGVVTLADLVGILDRQASEGTWAYRMLYDAQNATFIPSPDDVRTLASRAQWLSDRHGPRGLVAVVTPQPSAFEMGTLYSNLSHDAHIRVRVFLNRSSAERWFSDMRSD